MKPLTIALIICVIAISGCVTIPVQVKQEIFELETLKQEIKVIKKRLRILELDTDGTLSSATYDKDNNLIEPDIDELYKGKRR